MGEAHELLKALAVVLCVSAAAAVLFQRLRQPVVLGYILTGLLVGPHLPIPLVADAPTIELLSELGVILLMFSLGLEFSLRKLVQVGPVAALTAVVETSIMIWLGFMAGQAFGWTPRESVFAGGLVAISSTTIIARAFGEQGIRGKLRELVLGVLIVEDLIAILLLAVLTSISKGGGMSAGELARSSGRLAAFLIGLLSVGMLLVPRAIRAVNRLKHPEISLLASVGLCFGIALLARAFGYSVALGAFLAGALISESGEEKRIEPLVLPVRDLFATIFFVSVGMQLDPSAVARHWLPVAVFTALVIAGKVVGVSVGAFLTGNGTRTSVQAGMSLAQIGEFSFIIAGLGLSLHATGDFLYPVAVAVSVLTTFTTPWLIRSAGTVAAFIDRKLPHPLQTFAALYGTWLERIRTAPGQKTTAAAVRRFARRLLVDAALLAALVIGAAVWLDPISAWVSARLHLSAGLSRALAVAGAAALAGPLLAGLVRMTRRLGLALAQAALPAEAKGKLDLAAAPRRALVLTLQLAVALLVGLPMLALTQPFLPRWAALAGFLLLLAFLGALFWRGATNLQGHVKAGAEMIVEALVSQARKHSATEDEEALEQARRLMPGIGEPVGVRLRAGSAAVGKTLAQLNLRGVTGAAALAIARGEEGVIVPSAHEVLREGDLLVLAGTHDAISAARDVLLGLRIQGVPEPAPASPEGAP